MRTELSSLLILDRYVLSDIESKIFYLSDNQKNGWILIGQHLWLVEKFELFKQEEKNSSYSYWLKSLAKRLDLKPSTLWKYRKVITMINELGIEHEAINPKNVTGLEQISRIFDHNKNTVQAIEYISQLNNKHIKVSELKEHFKQLIAVKIIENDINSTQKNLTTKFTDTFYDYLVSPFLVKTACVLVGIITMSPIN
jgi:flagellar biosynthesis/type III secretory pathway chaperone